MQISFHHYYDDYFQNATIADITLSTASPTTQNMTHDIKVNNLVFTSSLFSRQPVTQSSRVSLNRRQKVILIPQKFTSKQRHRFC